MSLQSFSDYIGNTNTMKNPLDTLFPGTRKAITKENPPKIVKEPIVQKAEDGITKIKNSIHDVKAKTTPFVFFGGIALIVYLISKK
jgi:hypothetical protein